MQTSGRYLWIGIVLALLAGCTTMTAEQRRQAYTDRLVDTCDRYGFVRSTPAFAQCVMQLDQADTRLREQRALAIMQHFRPTPSYTTTCQPWLGGVQCQTR